MGHQLSIHQAPPDATDSNQQRLQSYCKNLPLFNGALDNDKILGRGNFGVVFEYVNAKQEPIAVKRISLAYYQGSEPNQMEDIQLFQSLQHKFIVKLHSAKRDNNFLYLFLELMYGGNLKELILDQHTKGIELSEEIIKKYLSQILLGLDYLHSRNIVHRDLKPANILLSADKATAKIADFGLSKNLSLKSGYSMNFPKGTIHYMAPEALNEKYSVKYDIWSVGASLIEMLTGKPPFAQCKNDFEVFKKLMSLGKDTFEPDYDLSTRPNLTPEGKEVLSIILQPFPASRPSASALLALDFFQPVETKSQDEALASNRSYSWHSKNVGRLLIIRNVNYETFAKRYESKKDAKQLMECFGSFGFEIVHKKNLTAEAMRKCIKEFAEEEENNNFSCIILVILAYDSAEGILGTDQCCIQLDKILKYMSPKCAPALKCKPKVLLVQASQVSEHFSSENSRNEANYRRWSTYSERQKGNTESLERIVYDLPDLRKSLMLAQNEGSSDSANQNFSIGIHSDLNNVLSEDSSYLNRACEETEILIGYSTGSSYYDSDDSYDGSNFIQKFCNAVKKHSLRMSLSDILSIASGDELKMVFGRTSERYFQVPQVVSTLRRHLLLPPPATKYAAYMSVQESTTTNDDSNDPEKFLIDHSRQVTASYSKFVSPCFGRSENEELTKSIVLVPAVDDTYAYDPEENTWRKAMPMTERRFQAAATVWNGKVVVAGGHGQLKHLNTVEQYDPKTDTWTALPEMINSRTEFVLVTYKNTLFAIGGFNEKETLSSVEKYGVKARHWELLDFELNCMRAHCGAALPTGILIAGGLLTSHWSSAQKSAVLLGSKSNECTKIAPLQNTRFYASAAAVKDKVYVLGGIDKTKKLLKSVEQYDSDNNHWTILSVELSSRKRALAVASLNEKIYIIGGEDAQWQSVLIAECFDTGEMTLESIAKLPYKIVGVAAAGVRVSNEAYKQLQEI